MNNVFNYKPKIQYILDEINTIDNVGGERESQFSTDFNSGTGSAAIEVLSFISNKVQTVKSIIDDRLKDITVQIGTVVLDDIVRELVKALPDGQKLINDGVITYNLYKNCLSDELLLPIVYLWDNYHSGIDGEIEAEMLPYITMVEDDVAGMVSVIQQTVLYDKPAANLAELREIETKQIEQYETLSRKLDALYRAENTDVAQVVSVKKQRDSIESRLKYNKAIVSMVTEFASEIGKMLGDVEMVIDTKTANKIIEFSKNNSNVIANKLKADEAYKRKIRLLTYQGFKAQREKINSDKEQFTSTFTRGSKEKAYKSAITNSRLTLDVSLPVLNDLDYIEVDDANQYSVMSILTGAEDMAKKHKAAMMNMKNILKATTKNARNNIKDIADKHITRVMYKNM